MSIIRFNDFAVRATENRLIELKLNNDTFLLYPGTAQGLAQQIEAATKSLFAESSSTAFETIISALQNQSSFQSAQAETQSLSVE
jgi:hypothetical protein